MGKIERLVGELSYMLTKKHLPGQHDQLTHGSWSDGTQESDGDVSGERWPRRELEGRDRPLGKSGGTEEKKIVDELLRRVEVEGGFSFDVIGWKYPTTGKMVSIYPDRESPVANLEEMSDEEVQKLVGDYVAENFDLLCLEEHYLGGWEEEGVLALDVSVRETDLEVALDVGREFNQIAVFDLDTGKTVYTGVERKLGE